MLRKVEPLFEALVSVFIYALSRRLQQDCWQAEAFQPWIPATPAPIAAQSLISDLGDLPARNDNTRWFWA
jgi:hypothetical protein